MTRFSFTNDITWGDGSGPRSISIATENLEGFDQYKAKMRAAVGEAVLRLGNAKKNLAGPLQNDVIAALGKYFLLAPPFPGDALPKIKSVINLTFLGLNSGPVQVKIHDAVPMAHRDFNGQVRMRPLGEIRKTNPKTRYSRPIYAVDFEQKRVGAIHVKGSALSLGKGGDVAARLLIHEATHKYAGTYDYHYFTGLTGELSADPWGDQDKALMNADSYAWFVWEVGDPMVTFDYVDD